MNILLTNDDGIYGVGLRALYLALSEVGHNVHVVAPMNEQSGVGHSITIFKPLRAREISELGFSGIGIYGTPADCVKLALASILPEKPDMVISGINAGANVGPDILYSGTVAAATEGTHSGIASLAISYDGNHPSSLLDQARHAARFVHNFDWQSVPSRCVLNMNYPKLDVHQSPGLCVCPQTSAIWSNQYDECHNPRGDRYWWIKGEIPADTVEEGTDRDMLTKGYITLTPLHFEFTQKQYMQDLQAKFPCKC